LISPLGTSSHYSVGDFVQSYLSDRSDLKSLSNPLKMWTVFYFRFRKVTKFWILFLVDVVIMEVSLHIFSRSYQVLGANARKLCFDTSFIRN